MGSSWATFWSRSTGARYRPSEALAARGAARRAARSRGSASRSRAGRRAHATDLTALAPRAHCPPGVRARLPQAESDLVAIVQRIRGREGSTCQVHAHAWLLACEHACACAGRPSSRQRHAHAIAATADSCCKPRATSKPVRRLPCASSVLRVNTLVQLQVLKHTGILENLQLWRISNTMRVLLLEQIGLWVQQLPSGGFTVARCTEARCASCYQTRERTILAPDTKARAHACSRAARDRPHGNHWKPRSCACGLSGCRVLDGKAARYSGQCAVGDLVVSISYVKPQSLDHVEELGL